jgi:hypothetical protein
MSNIFGIQERMADFPNAVSAASVSMQTSSPAVDGAAPKAINTYYEGSGADRMQITEFDNGYIKRVSASEESVSDAVSKYMNQQNALEFQQGVETATSILQSTLKYYGMEDTALLAEIKTALADRRLTGNSTMDDIGIQLRESPAFKQRFAGNEALRAKGKPMYSVSQYLQLEASYKQQLIAAGMPKGFYDTNTDFANFIANETSPDELAYRLQQGYAAVKNADPTVVNELKSMYGLEDGTIAAFFLDPAKTRDEVIRAANAAQIANQARKQAGFGLNVSEAELLAKQGVSESQAQQGFAQIKQQEELLRPTIGEQALTQQELIAGTFGTSGAAAQRVATTRRRRQATFEGGGQAGLSTVGE